MKPIYEENEETLEIAEQISCHIPPHLHKSMELVSVTEGTLEIGVGTELHQFCPVNPVILSQEVHPDVNYALRSMLVYPAASQGHVLHQAFIQIILARTLPLFEMIDKSSVGSNDIIYQTVSYIAAHYTEELTLSKMAHDLGISQSSLSRVFSSTFHTNFNRYLNEARLDYACSLLLHSDHTILDICIRAGFDSQRTFNRVFQERYHMSPREYRKQPH
jgi:AraC-like DNA-binding protein